MTSFASIVTNTAWGDVGLKTDAGNGLSWRLVASNRARARVTRAEIRSGE